MDSSEQCSRVEIPERCSRVDKQERCSLCGNPEIYSRMETVERSSQVGRVERGREGRKKRVVQQRSTGREGRPKWVAQQKNMGHRNRKKSAETMGKQTARAGQTGGQEETNRDLPLISSHRQNRKTTFSSFFLCFFSQKTRERSENPKI